MYYGSNPACTQARKFHLFFPPTCHCESKLYLAIRQVLDSLMTCVRVTHTLALSPDKVCLFGLCRNLLIVRFAMSTRVNFPPTKIPSCHFPRTQWWSVDLRNIRMTNIVCYAVYLYMRHTSCVCTYAKFVQKTSTERRLGVTQLFIWSVL